MLSYLEQSVPAREAAEFLGAALPLLLFLSPLPLVVGMCRTKKVGNTPPLPFIAGLGTNVLWLLAGVGMSKTAMIVPNAFGLCLHFCYVVVYYLALKSELATVAAVTTKEAPRSKTPTKADTKRSRSRSPMKKAAGASSPMKKTEAAGGGASASSAATKYATGNAALLATRSSFVRLMLLAAVAITVGAVGLVTGNVDVTSGLASALNIVMMGAPAAALRTVWKTWDPSHLGIQQIIL